MCSSSELAPGFSSSRLSPSNHKHSSALTPWTTAFKRSLLIHPTSLIDIPPQSTRQRSARFMVIPVSRTKPSVRFTTRLRQGASQRTFGLGSTPPQNPGEG
jgi:hypothetical protein